MKARNALNRPNADRSPPRRLRRAWPLLFGVLLLVVSCSEGPTTPRDLPNVLAFVTGDSTVTVLDAETNVVLNAIRVGHGARGVAVTPDRTTFYVANSASEDVSAIDVASAVNRGANAVTATISAGGFPEDVAVTPDGAKVYMADGGTGHVLVIDRASESVTGSIPIGDHGTEGIAVSPDGGKVYVASRGRPGHVVVIDVATDSVTATIQVGEDPKGVAVTPDGDKVYVANWKSLDVSVIDVAAGIVTETISIRGRPWEIAVTPDGAKVYVVHSNVTAIDVETDAITERILVPQVPGRAEPLLKGVAVTPDGSKVYTTDEGTGSVWVVDVTSDSITERLSHGGNPWGVAIR